MTQSFDDFAQQRANKKDDRARLVMEMKAEWEILKGLVSQFAIDGKRLGNQNFKSERSMSGREMLVLANVAAIFLDDGDMAGVPQNTRIRFTRRPAGSGQAYIDDCPLADTTWTLQPVILGDEFVWTVIERAEPYTAAEIAEEIAKELGQYHIDYENAFWPRGLTLEKQQRCPRLFGSKLKT